MKVSANRDVRTLSLQPIHNLIQGVRLALALPLKPGMHVNVWCCWFIALFGMATDWLLGYLWVPEPRLFYWDGVVGSGFWLALVALCGGFGALVFRRSGYAVALPLAWLNALWLPQIIAEAFYSGLFERLGETAPQWVPLAWYALLSWHVLVVLRVLTWVTGRWWQSVLVGPLMAAVLFLPGFYLYVPQFWEVDYQAMNRSTSTVPPVDAERTLTRQWALVQKQLDAVAPSEPGQVDLFFAGFAGDATQAVFKREVGYVQRQFDQRFGSNLRSAVLVNHPSTLNRVPLASVSNLRRLLAGMGERAQTNEDILFLFLTTHGSPEPALSANYPSLPLNDLTPEDLNQALSDSGFKWAVVVISACYSGGFIDPLAAPDRAIITAARFDRTSFGCSDTNDFTYFGQAFFEQGLAHTHSLTTAFTTARERVAAREQAGGYTPSRPQMVVGPAIDRYLSAHFPLLTTQPETTEEQP
ncbi:C13 family peptidase [Marinobacteraceae bacterium S3BR75-40.1]